MRRKSLRVALQWLQWVLLLGGVACATWVYATARNAAFYQRYAKDEMAHITIRPLPDDAWRPRIVQSAMPGDSLIGVLSIPSVDLSVAVVEGDTDQALRIGAGHLPDTPLPWEGGNSAVAAHRDTFFAPLQAVRGGDEISIVTRHGTLRYRVVFMTIVGPDDVSVLAPSAAAELTLITCYPFGYLGPAPERFIIQAVRIVSDAAP